jgi:hypothetical protein
MKEKLFNLFERYYNSRVDKAPEITIGVIALILFSLLGIII